MYIGLLLGGILGGILVSRDGMKKWLWLLVCAITLPDVVYIYELTQTEHSRFIEMTENYRSLRHIVDTIKVAKEVSDWQAVFL